MEETKEQVEETAPDDLDALKEENESLKSQLSARQDFVNELEQKLTEKTAEITSLKQSLGQSVQDTESLRLQLEGAVAAYKEMVEQANPGLVAGMVKGETIEEINESLKTARALVERVKQEVAAENAKVRVPAGAPQRTPPDLSGLTSREKIKYAMEGN